MCLCLCVQIVFYQKDYGRQMQDVLAGTIDAAIVLGSWFESNHPAQVKHCGQSVVKVWSNCRGQRDAAIVLGSWFESNHPAQVKLPWSKRGQTAAVKAWWSNCGGQRAVVKLPWSKGSGQTATIEAQRWSNCGGRGAAVRAGRPAHGPWAAERDGSNCGGQTAAVKLRRSNCGGQTVIVTAAVNGQTF